MAPEERTCSGIANGKASHGFNIHTIERHEPLKKVTAVEKQQIVVGKNTNNGSKKQKRQLAIGHQPSSTSIFTLLSRK
ncbi:hypothetical protein GU926_14725 [Nibribacter ruber]|uniref:Uncharacterized protein n=1 Tax=Nibribacter ruber TaxID=2698458 RepID=A0A6P1P2I2_9BACT|nr:hypothetical protein [Nibribacter ruber]QHL88614.1 hypothetical protein GU926_14725 [Nibribacter ruber]